MEKGNTSNSSNDGGDGNRFSVTVVELIQNRFQLFLHAIDWMYVVECGCVCVRTIFCNFVYKSLYVLNVAVCFFKLCTQQRLSRARSRCTINRACVSVFNTNIQRERQTRICGRIHTFEHTHIAHGWRRTKQRQPFESMSTMNSSPLNVIHESGADCWSENVCKKKLLLLLWRNSPFFFFSYIFRHNFGGRPKRQQNKAKKRKFYTSSHIELSHRHTHTHAYNIRGEYVNRCATKQEKISFVYLLLIVNSKQRSLLLQLLLLWVWVLVVFCLFHIQSNRFDSFRFVLCCLCAYACVCAMESVLLFTFYLWKNLRL